MRREATVPCRCKCDLFFDLDGHRRYVRCDEPEGHDGNHNGFYIQSNGRNPLLGVESTTRWPVTWNERPSK